MALSINGLNSPIKKHRVSGPSLVVQRLGLDLPTQEEQVQPLVGKLGSHMPHGWKTKTESRNNTITNPIKTLKMVHIQKKINESL